MRPRTLDGGEYSVNDFLKIILDALELKMPPPTLVEISDLESIIREMIFIARKMMPDQISAERLVEAVLHRAISQANNNAFEGDIRDRLKILLNEEYRLRASHYLN